VIALDESNRKHCAFARLAIAQRDIGGAQRIICQIEELNPSHDVYETLMIAATILYCRPFIGTRAYPGIPAKFARFGKPSFQALHDGMISSRNRFVAHCDRRDVKVQILPKGTQFRAPDGSILTVYRHGTSVSTSTFQRKGLPLFKSVCSFQLERLGKHINAMSHELFPTKA